MKTSLRLPRRMRLFLWYASCPSTFVPSYFQCHFGLLGTIKHDNVPYLTTMCCLQPTFVFRQGNDIVDTCVGADPRRISEGVEKLI